MITEKKKREFRMHSNLLKEVIKKQTGSIDRAIQEAVSNSVDSGASTINIEISGTKIVISDDGKGFVSEEEITDVFETFGKPHSVTEAKKFGKFRMGRGQLFAHGRNVWRTNEFVMEVDIDNPDESNENTDEQGHGLGYSLHKSLDGVQPGCQITIELYKPLSMREVVELNETITDAFRYLDTTVKLNGSKINVNPHKVEWKTVQDYFVANLSLDRKNLRLFNQGVHVRTYSYDTYYISGDICTTVDMELNFARNEPMNDCMVWKSIRDAIPGVREDLLEVQRAEKAKQEAEERRNARNNSEPRERKEPSEYQKNKPSLTTQERKERFEEIIRKGQLVDERYDATQPFIRGFCASTKKNTTWFSPVKLLRDIKKTRNKIVIIDQASLGYYKAVRAAKLKLATPVAMHSLPEQFSVVSKVVEKTENGEVVKDEVKVLSPDEQLQTFLQIVNNKTRTNYTDFKVLTDVEIDKLLDAYEVRLKRENLNAHENAMHTAISEALGYFGSHLLKADTQVEVCEFGQQDLKMRYVKKTKGADKAYLLINKRWLKNSGPISFKNCVSIIKEIFLHLEEHIQGPSKPKRENFPLWIVDASVAMLRTVVDFRSRNDDNELIEDAKNLKLDAARALDKLKQLGELSFSRAMLLAKLCDLQEFVAGAIQRAEHDTGLTTKEILTDTYTGELTCKLTPELEKEFSLLEAKLSKKQISL